MVVERHLIKIILSKFICNHSRFQSRVICRACDTWMFSL